MWISCSESKKLKNLESCLWLSDVRPSIASHLGWNKFSEFSSLMVMSSVKMFIDRVLLGRVFFLFVYFFFVFLSLSFVCFDFFGYENLRWTYSDVCSITESVTPHKWISLGIQLSGRQITILVATCTPGVLSQSSAPYLLVHFFSPIIKNNLTNFDVPCMMNCSNFKNKKLWIRAWWQCLSEPWPTWWTQTYKQHNKSKITIKATLFFSSLAFIISEKSTI